MSIRVKAEIIPPTEAPRGRATSSFQKGSFMSGMRVTGPGGTGPFQEWLARNANIAAAAVTAGIKVATEGLKTDLRRAVVAGGLGDKLPNAIRAEMFPRNGASFAAAGWIYVKGVKTRAIIEAYANGAIIRAKGGRYLAIPTEAGKGLLKARGGAAFVSSSYGLGIKTRLVVPKASNAKGTLFIVADLAVGRGKRGGYRKPTPGKRARRNIEEDVVLFILVPQATVKRRITIDGLPELWAARVPGLIDKALPDL
nr:DUF6441 family protein [uncultured Dongia sp.]